MAELQEGEKETPEKDQFVETRQLLLIKIELLLHLPMEIEVERQENREHGNIENEFYRSVNYIN